jgi:hypothetical protein
VELEERSIDQLPDRCENCGTALTAREKETALEEGMTVVLCTTCSVEAEAMPEDEAEDFGGGA